MSIVTLVEIAMLPNGEGLDVPAYQTVGAAGMDLICALQEGEVVTLEPGDTRLFGAGFKMSLPPGLAGYVLSRSGLTRKFGLIVANAPGLIDSDYTGEMGMLMRNTGNAPVTIERGMRLAQLVVAPVQHVHWIQVGGLRETERGAGGFGSTGIAA